MWLFQSVTSEIIDILYVLETIKYMDCVIEALKKEFTVENGYEYDILFPYGDSDSVMMDFGPVSDERRQELCLIANKIMTQSLKSSPPEDHVWGSIDGKKYVVNPNIPLINIDEIYETYNSDNTQEICDSDDEIRENRRENRREDLKRMARMMWHN